MSRSGRKRGVAPNLEAQWATAVKELGGVATQSAVAEVSVAY